MTDTSLSLMDQLSDTEASEAWETLVELYQPLLRHWIRKHDVPEAEAADLVQEVLLAVSTDIREFHHNGREGAFRAWLKQILINRLRNYWRRNRRHPQPARTSEFQQQLDALEDPHSDQSRAFDQEHDLFIIQQVMRRAKPSFQATTWQAFTRVVLDRQSADQVAAELGLTVNGVFIAKSRVLNRLRLEAKGLVDADSKFIPNL